MTQAEINRQVAQATGETVRTIAERGFALLSDTPDDPDEYQPLVVDWDQLDAKREFVQPIPLVCM